MKIIFSLATIFTLTIAGMSNSMAAVYTSWGEVDVIQTVASTGTTLVSREGGNGWGAPGCRSVNLLKLFQSSPGYKEMLAEILTAKAAKFSVRGLGNCSGASFEVIQLQIK